MPWKYIPPDIAIKDGKTKIYHAYKGNEPMTYFFCTNPEECEDGGEQFDIRRQKYFETEKTNERTAISIALYCLAAHPEEIIW